MWINLSKYFFFTPLSLPIFLFYLGKLVIYNALNNNKKIFKMKIKPIIRNRDVIYGNRDLKTIYTFKKFPVFMGATKDNHKKDKFLK